MSDTKELLERAWKNAPQPDRVMDSLIRRRARRQRNRRIAAALLALSVALLSFAAVIRTFRTVQRPANEPTPAPSPSGIFADVGGWIVYGNESVKHGPLGIWAVDPTRPNDPEARIPLSERPGKPKPLAWSSDGSKLLIWRERRVRGQGHQYWKQIWTGLFVLNADGTETRLVTKTWNVGVGVESGGRYIHPGGSFSPDGSKVAFATLGGMYTVDADGGTPRILAEGGADPTFSPDGTKIAYDEFRDKPGHTLRVINADGTGDRELLDAKAVNCIRPILVRPAWSPDGTKIAFSCSGETGIQVVGADGSDLRTVIPNGHNPYWSPDGSRIAFEVEVVPVGRRLAIANADGTHVQLFEYPTRAGPWNPLSLSESGDREPATAEDGSGAAPFVYAIVLLGVVGVLVLAWRARRRTGAR